MRFVPCDVLVPLSLSLSEADSLSLSLFLSLSLTALVAAVTLDAPPLCSGFFLAMGFRPPPFFRFDLACFFLGGVFIVCS